MSKRAGILFVSILSLSLSAYAEQASQTPTSKAPAPRRNLDGVWSGGAVMRLEEFAQMTPAGQKLYAEAKPLYGSRALPVAESNHSLVTCDPLGFPQNVLYELRNVEFQQTKNKMLILVQYQRVFREIWTDGRALPTNVGSDTPGSPDARWYGYSVGRWADDYTFVVTSTGFNEKSWATAEGHPRSMNARVEERYRRIDHDTLEVTVTIDDPKNYTKPFVAMKQQLRWSPKQEYDEQLCVPSEALEYLSIFKPVAGPAK